jgi:hypothetical protein
MVAPLGPHAVHRAHRRPWAVEETDACFIVKDYAGMSLAYVYFEN